MKYRAYPQDRGKATLTGGSKIHSQTSATGSTDSLARKAATVLRLQTALTQGHKPTSTTWDSDCRQQTTFRGSATANMRRGPSFRMRAQAIRAMRLTSATRSTRALRPTQRASVAATTRARAMACSTSTRTTLRRTPTPTSAPATFSNYGK